MAHICYIENKLDMLYSYLTRPRFARTPSPEGRALGCQFQFVELLRSGGWVLVFLVEEKIFNIVKIVLDFFVRLSIIRPVLDVED